MEQRKPLHDEICGVGERLAFELSEFLPRELVLLMGYLSMVTAATGITATGEMMVADAIENYIRFHRQVMCTRVFFSEKYNEVGIEVCELMEQAQRRTLSEDDVARVYLLSAWQAENFLTSFHPEAVDLDNYVPARAHMASMLGVDLSSLLVSPDPEPTAHAQREEESDGEEKIDVSEKDVSSSLTNGNDKDNCSEDISATVSANSSSFCGISACQMSNGNAKVVLALLEDESQWDPDLLVAATAQLRRAGKLTPLRYQLSLHERRWLAKVELLRCELEELTAACHSTDIEIIRQTLTEAQTQTEQGMLRMLSILQHIRSVLGPPGLEDIGNETLVVLLDKILGHYRQNPSILVQLSSQFKSELFRSIDA